MAKRVKHLLPGTEIVVLPGLVPLLEPIDAVQPDLANPRHTRNLAALIDSIRRFGLRVPVVANRRDKLIEKGHQTYEALRQMGACHIAVLWADDERSRAQAFNVADNRTAEVVAEWDEKGLAEVLRAIDDYEGIGYTNAQVEGILASFGAFEMDLQEPSPLPKTGFEGSGEGLLSGRVILTFDGDEQRVYIEKLLGFLITKITYRYEEVLAARGEA